MAFVRAMYKKGTGNDKQGKDAGNRTLCPYRNFSQAIKADTKHKARCNARLKCIYCLTKISFQKLNQNNIIDNFQLIFAVEDTEN